MFGFFSKYKQYKTTNANNPTLSTFNGTFNIKSIPLHNILINGNANIGEKSKETIFKDVVVVNGNLNSQHSSFEILEVNGSTALKNCTVTTQGEFFGNVSFDKCILADLRLSGRDFILKDTLVKGNIKAIAISGRGRLVLDNSVVNGSAEFDNGDIFYVNGGRVENNQE